MTEEDERPVREQYQDVLSRLIEDTPTPLPRVDALNDEIEQAAHQLVGYFDAYREWLHAEALHHALVEAPQRSPAAESALTQSASRVQSARESLGHFEAELQREIGYLLLLLKLREEDQPVV
jgi:hypothetical protein